MVSSIIQPSNFVSSEEGTEDDQRDQGGTSIAEVPATFVFDTATTKLNVPYLIY